MTTKDLSLNDCIVLVANIILQAIEDLFDEDIKIQKDAKEYFYCKDFENYCLSLRADPDYIRKQVEINNGVELRAILQDISTEGIKQRENVPFGFLKKLTEEELKKYRSTYRKNRAKQLTFEALLSNSQ